MPATLRQNRPKRHQVAPQTFQPQLVGNQATNASRHPVAVGMEALFPSHIDQTLIATDARAWSTHTIKAFLADLRFWQSWCRLVKLDPAAATAETVVAFIQHCSQPSLQEARGRLRLHRDDSLRKNPHFRKVATLERYLSSLRTAYRWAGLPDPTRAEQVAQEMQVQRRARGFTQEQAHPLRFKGDVTDPRLDRPEGICLARLLYGLHRDWTGRTDLIGLRDRAMLLVAYDTAFRPFELVAVRIEDIEGPFDDGSGLLSVPRSSPDQKGEGRQAYLSPQTMDAIGAFCAVSRLNSGPLFRFIPVHSDGSPREIRPRAVRANSIPSIYRRIVRQAWEQGAFPDVSEAELNEMLPRINGQSTRAGIAQDSLAVGEDLQAIMQTYGWRDPRTVLRHGKQLAARGGTAQRLTRKMWGEE